MNKFTLKFVLFLCMCYSHTVFAQDYILLKEGDNLTVKILRIDSTKVCFRQFENADTTEYFLLKENISALGFGSNLFKRMKNVTFKKDPVYKSVSQIATPVYIYPVGGELVKAVIDNFTESQIQFRLANSSDTSTYFLNKAEIEQVTFKEIAKEQIVTDDEELSESDLINKARLDAYKNYDGYRGATIGAFISGMACFYLVPIVVPIVLSIIPPSEDNLGIPDVKLAKNPAYLNSYSKTAHRIKSNKVWSNFGYGALTTVGGTILIFFLVLASIH